MTEQSSIAALSSLQQPLPGRQLGRYMDQLGVVNEAVVLGRKEKNAVVWNIEVEEKSLKWAATMRTKQGPGHILSKFALRY